MHIHTSNQDTLHLGFGGYTANWGFHMAGLYENEAERDEIITGYLATGAEANNLQLYTPVEQSAEAFKQKILKHKPGLKEKLEDPDILKIQYAKYLYYPKGYFSPWEMDKSLNTFYENEAQNQGRSVRATAEMSWAIEAIPGTENLMAYESRLNYFIPGKPWISICMYNLKKFSGDIIMQVLQTHPYVINGGIITQNPYYQDPDAWLAKNAPEFLPKS